MKFVSTRHSDDVASFAEALLNGLAKNGGLYVPCQHPHGAVLPKAPSAYEATLRYCRNFLADTFSHAQLQGIIETVFAIPFPLVRLEDNLFVLELFHGKTCAFKDVGATFLAEAMTLLNAHHKKERVILVATSGDTGSAVGHAFKGKPGIKVALLYPSGKVSRIQEQQLTTIGDNVTAIEVYGTFDDCQRLVKEAFQDPLLRLQYDLGSANSINIARLFPQTFYYISAIYTLCNFGIDPEYANVHFSVPSGNFGNVTAGIMGQLYGEYQAHFVAATNTNSVVADFLNGHPFTVRPSIQTISNAMDVGNPSNIERLSVLLSGHTLHAQATPSPFENDIRQKIAASMTSISFSEEQTRNAISELYARYSYIADPHTAIGYLGAKAAKAKPNSTTIILATAHPAKFLESVQPLIAQPIPLPTMLADALRLKKVSHPIEPTLDDLRTTLKAIA